MARMALFVIANQSIGTEEEILFNPNRFGRGS
jgi:hypothetical protein